MRFRFAVCALLALLFATTANADEPVQTQSVMSSAATVLWGGGLDVQGTVGETCVSTLSGAFVASEGFWSRVTVATTVAAPDARSYDFELRPNTPNPFNPVTTFSFTVPGSSGASAQASLVIFDVNGRTITTLIDASLPAGDHAIVWRGSDDHGKAVGSGIYFARLTVGSHTATTRSVLLK